MTTITITIPDDRLQKLKELSSFFRISTEDLIRVSTVFINFSGKARVSAIR